MTRPPNEASELIDADKRDLIALIQAGKPRPEKYRFILVEDKREVDLVRNGKTRDVCTTVLPLQTLARRVNTAPGRPPAAVAALERRSDAMQMRQSTQPGGR